MIPPSKRIWLYPDRTYTHPRDLEIIVLGTPTAIAPFVAELRVQLESWAGFENVHAIAMGDQMIGFRVTRSKFATHDDPVAEAMLALDKLGRIEWHSSSRAGTVGLW